MQQINNLSAKINKYQDQIKVATNRVMASGWLILGPEVTQFETAFANYLGASHCICVGNGTDAIELALRAMGVEAGDHVATVANAGMYTTIALLAIGAKPYFLDVDLTTHNVTLAEVKQAVAAGVKAIVVTHLYGLMVPEIEAIAQYCSQKSIPLLEDCAQVHGAKINGQYAGTFGDAASFSFYPTKNLGALGDGGAIITSRFEIFERVKRLRQYGWTTKYQVGVPGARNSRLDDIQAAILSVFLPVLDELNARRRDIATRYTDGITHPNIVTPPKSGAAYVAHLYVVRCQHRNKLREHLSRQHIASEIHYPIPDHEQPIFGKQFQNISLPHTEQLKNEVMTLPCYPEMSDAEVDHVIDSVNGWVL